MQLVNDRFNSDPKIIHRDIRRQRDINNAFRRQHRNLSKQNEVQKEYKKICGREFY